MPTIEAVESLILLSLQGEKVLCQPEPYRIETSYLEKIDREGDLIASVDGQINLTAIARAIVEASHDR